MIVSIGSVKSENSTSRMNAMTRIFSSLTALCLYSLRWVDVARVNIPGFSCGSDEKQGVEGVRSTITYEPHL